MIVALSGYGGSGKNAVADVLVAEYGYAPYAWADTLRLAASKLNPIVHVYDGHDGAVVRYNDAIEMVGYTEAKVRFPETRNILQLLGTDVCRDLFGENVWVDATLARIEREQPSDAKIALTDCRFPNEASAIREMNGCVVRVERPGVGPVNNHISETGLDDFDFDYTLLNDGSLDDLRVAVKDLYKFVESSL